MQATLEEIRELGPERASLRSIARRIGISHQAVAYHFADRTALFTEVAALGWRDLTEACRREPELHAPDDEPGAGVAAMGAAYAGFARSDPERFRLMFGSRLIDPSAPSIVAGRAEVWRMHLDAVRDAVEAGWGDGTAVEVLAVATWSAAHGLATLERDVPGEQVIHMIAAGAIRLPQP